MTVEALFDNPVLPVERAATGHGAVPGPAHRSDCGKTCWLT